jgi:hypothetical protein
VTTEHITPRGQGNVECSYLIPDIESYRLDRIALLGPMGGSTQRMQAAYVTFDGGVEVCGKRVHPYDLIRFCDTVLNQFTGEDLSRARG